MRKRGGAQANNETTGAALCRRLTLALLCVFSCARALAVDAEFIWDPNSEVDLAGYNLYHATDGATETNIITLGTVTQATVRDLESGRRYTFFLTAFNTAGLESGPSDLVTLTMPETEGLVLSGLRMTPQGLEFSWEPDAGRAYRILYKDDLNDPTWTELITVTAGTNPQVFRDYSTEPDNTPTYLVNRQRFYRIVAVP